jgi:hypothetical protein
MDDEARARDASLPAIDEKIFSSHLEPVSVRDDRSF